MEEFSLVFEGVEDPRRCNATRHDLYEILLIGLLSTMCGGEGCTDMAFSGSQEKRSCGPSCARSTGLRAMIPSRICSMHWIRNSSRRQCSASWRALHENWTGLRH